MDSIFYDKRIIVCPICHNRIGPNMESDVAKAYYNIIKEHGRCLFCGCELALYADGATVMEPIKEIEPDFILDGFVFLQRGEIGIVASRPVNGEITFFSSLMNQPAEDIEVIDLYSEERAHGSLFAGMGGKYRTLLEIEKKNKNHKSSCLEKLISAIRDMDHPDYIILFGIQAVQKNPFEPEEMHGILKELRALAVEKDTPIVIYSGLLRDCDEHTPSEVDLEKIGIDENLCDLTAALKNYRVVYYRGNQIK